MNSDRAIQELARQIEELRYLVTQRGPQLAHSSMDDGSIGEYTTDPATGAAQLVARYGSQWDGAHGAVAVVGPTPPTPDGIEGVAISTGILARWGGGWLTAPSLDPNIAPTPTVTPSDFTRIEIHVTTDPDEVGFGILFSTYRGSIESPRGGEIPLVGLQSNTDYYLCATARTTSGKFSARSTVFGPIRTGQIQPDEIAIDFDAIGGNLIHKGPDAPEEPNRIGDLWLKTPENVAYRWEGDPADWVESRDTGVAEALEQAFDANAAAVQAGLDAIAAQGVAADAQSAVGGAVAAAEAASDDAAAASALAAAAQSTANGKITAFRQASAPSTTGRTTGDIWIDSDDGKVYVWDGAWTLSDDQRIGTLVTSNATKVTVFAQISAPSTSGRTTGDIWLDTDDGNKQYVWDGAWTARTFGAAAIAATARQLGAITTYRQATAPASGMLVGDFWIDSDDNKLYRYEGTVPAWTAVQDVGIQAAITSAATAQSTADGKMRIFPQASAPTGLTAGDVGDMWIDIDDGNKAYTWSGSAWTARQFGNSAIEPASLVASNVIATGTVTAALLEALLILATTIIAGDPNGDHARLDSLGLRVFSIDPDGQVVESGSFGGSGPDRLLIIDPATGSTLAAINSDGAAFPKVTTDNLIVAGNTIDYILGDRPRGLISRAGINTGVGNTTTTSGSYDAQFLAEPGRSYRIETTPLNLNPSVATAYVFAALVLRVASAGPTLISSPVMCAQRGSPAIAGGIVPLNLNRTVSFDELFTIMGISVPTVPTLIRVGLIFGMISGGGTVSMFGNAQYPIHTYINDVGPVKPFTGILNLGGGTAAPIVSNYQTDWAATWAANWNGTNNSPRTGETEIVQGYTPYYTAPGSGIGQVGFGANGSRSDGQITGTTAVELSGSNINWAALYVYSTHWYYNSGGSVILGGHPYASAPATKPADWQLSGLVSPGHPKGGGKWIYLPAGWFTGLANGVTRGFTFGDGVSTANDYYGRIAADPSDNRRPVLRVNYNK